jgi:hypothetical protein
MVRIKRCAKSGDSMSLQKQYPEGLKKSTDQIGYFLAEKQKV